MNYACGYLCANIWVAANLRVEKERAEAAAEHEKTWNSLVARAEAMGCKLQPCYLDPESDGSCDCGPGLFDRDGNPVGDLASDEASQDLEMMAALIEKLETTGGLRW